MFDTFVLDGSVASGRITGDDCYFMKLHLRDVEHKIQIVQQRLVEMLEGITLGQLMAYRLGRMKDAGTMKHTQVSLAKRHNVMMARNVASLARWTLGANGVHSEYQVMRHMANIESVFTYEGTHDIHTLVVGQDITGISAFE